MTALDDALRRLRGQDPPLPAGPVGDGFRAAEVSFAALGGPIEARWQQAIAELAQCVRPLAGSPPVLCEGGVYPGTWIEGTGSISAEVAGRFVPQVATDSFLIYARHQRADGLIPYKVIDSGPGYSQIQIVSPLARSVWHHYLLTGRDRAFLRTMYDAMVANDGWLAAHRDTRGTGGVEAFCTFDTGHDLSPRFWFVPDRCPDGDAARYDPASPLLPYVAPDLTANVACQRTYLAQIAAELGEGGEPWHERAATSLAALQRQCFDAGDRFYYDRAADGSLVRVQSDVLLRVLTCEVGDEEFFASALETYLLNTGKFLSHYGFTSLALDDPRFDHDHTRNSWGGPVNFLSLIRAPHAFEHHGHVAELALTWRPLLSAVAAATTFPQCLDPWTGTAGFTSVYSPAILWFLDTVERSCGVLPRPDGDLWFSGLPPTRLEHGTAAAAAAYSRTVGGVRYELAADDASVEVHRDGAPWLRFPVGWRVIVGADGEPAAVVGLSAATVPGDLVVAGRAIPLSLGPNQRVDLASGVVGGPRFVPPHW